MCWLLLMCVSKNPNGSQSKIFSRNTTDSVKLIYGPVIFTNRPIWILQYIRTRKFINLIEWISLSEVNKALCNLIAASIKLQGGFLRVTRFFLPPFLPFSRNFKRRAFCTRDCNLSKALASNLCTTSKHVSHHADVPEACMHSASP